MSKYAKIISLEDFKDMRDTDEKFPHLGTIVATSGGYDPAHPGHLSCLIESKQYGDTLVAIVNGDWFLTNKKGKPFIDLATRCKIISCIREVDYVIPFEIEDDSTVCKALEAIRPHIFTKGGDRTDFTNIPEWDVCQKYDIEIVPQVGLDKEWSSSDFLADWTDHILDGKVLATRNCEDYLIVDGVHYERLTGNTVNLELDLDDNTIDNLDEMVRTQQFSSRGEALRAALRAMMEKESNKQLFQPEPLTEEELSQIDPEDRATEPSED